MHKIIILVSAMSLLAIVLLSCSLPGFSKCANPYIWNPERDGEKFERAHLDSIYTMLRPEIDQFMRRQEALETERMPSQSGASSESRDPNQSITHNIATDISHGVRGGARPARLYEIGENEGSNCTQPCEFFNDHDGEIVEAYLKLKIDLSPAKRCPKLPLVNSTQDNLGVLHCFVYRHEESIVSLQSAHTLTYNPSGSRSTWSLSIYPSLDHRSKVKKGLNRFTVEMVCPYGDATVDVVEDNDIYVSANIYFPKRLAKNAKSSPEEQLDSIRCQERFDVILELTHRRKDDLSAVESYARHSYFAEYGFVSIAVDARGTGDSGGFTDNRKFDSQDIFALVRYFRAFDWSSGRAFLFGMHETSTTCLHVTAKYPNLISGCVIIGLSDDVLKGFYHQGCIIPSNVARVFNASLAADALPNVRAFRKDVYVNKLEDTRPSKLFEVLSMQNLSPVRLFTDSVPAKKTTCPILLIAGVLDRDSANLTFDLSADNGLGQNSRIIIGPWKSPVGAPDFDLQRLAIMWFRQETRILEMPRLSIFCSTQNKWLSVAELKTATFSVNLDRSGTYLKDPHIFQGLWNGSWTLESPEDFPGSQDMSNDYSDTWQIPIDNDVIICGPVKLFIELKNVPDRSYLGASLCEIWGEEVTQLANGIRFICDTKGVILELGVICRKMLPERHLVLALKTSCLPLTASLPSGGPIIVTNLDVRMPILTVYCEGSVQLGVSNTQLRQLPHKLTVDESPHRNVLMQLGGRMNDLVSIVRENGPKKLVLAPKNGEKNGPQCEIGEESKEITETDFGMSKPTRYTTSHTYTLKRNGFAFMSTAKTALTLHEPFIDASASLEVYCDGERVYSSRWERQFQRNS